MPIANKWQTVLLSMALLMVLNGSAWAGQKCDASKPETTPLARFVIEKERGIVFDTMNSLTWKICPEGMAYSNGRCKGSWLYEWNEARDTSIGGWRLPNIDELMSIVEKRCTKPAINLQVFPDTRSEHFWSSSSFVDDHGYAYSVFFGRGFISNDLKSNAYSIRLVLGPEWRDGTLDNLGKKK